MRFWTLLRRSLLYYAAPDLAVGLGVAVGVAAITGSLLVGDSVRGSLRDMALERLGSTEHALVSPTFFRETLAADIAARPEFTARYGLCVPLVLLRGAVQKPDPLGGPPETVSGVQVLGVRPDFWRVGTGPEEAIEGREAILNRALADDLGVSDGDALLLSVGRPGDAPADSLLGRRSRQDVERKMRLVVRKVLPTRGPGGFSVSRDRPVPRNLYLSLPWLQERLDRPRKVNALLVARARAKASGPETLQATLGSCMTPEDYGLRLRRVGAPPAWQLESLSFVVREAFVSAALGTAKDLHLQAGVVSAYLLNSMRRPESGLGVPYSLAVGLGAPLDALQILSGHGYPLANDEIVLSQWAADDLSAAVGDRVEATFYAAGGRGELATRTRSFTLKGVAAMSGPAVDRDLVPEFEGVARAESIRHWNLPFPVDLDRVRPKDEDYWKKYRTSPKAFLSLEAARGMWNAPDEGSPQGDAAGHGAWVTSVRLAPGQESGPDAGADFERSLLRRLRPSDAGFVFTPVKEEALRAAQGSTDFSVLFLSMSFFLVAASAGLVGLLLRLSLETRARQLGLLLSVGFRPRSVWRIMSAEGLALALGGAVLGVPGGIGYAWLILKALQTRWSGAVGGFPVFLHVAWTSPIVGGLAGVVVAAAAMGWSFRVLRRAHALTLLFGWQALALPPGPRTRSGAALVAWSSLALAGALLVASLATGAVPVVGAFFACGSAILASGLAFCCVLLCRSSSGMARSMWSLSLRDASRRWTRALLSAGLMACATFIIVTVAANRLDLSTLDTTRKDGGAGGFCLVAKSDLPIYEDINTPKGRERLGMDDRASAALAPAWVVPFRVRDGDDASCLNAGRPLAPRVLGVPEELIRRGGFAFSAVQGEGGGDENPWRLLERDLGEDVVPAFGDEASVRWILHLGLGDEISLPDRRGQAVRLRIVGMLRQSVFQSELLVSERSFSRHFDRESGYRHFLVQAPRGSETAVGAALRTSLAGLGLEVTRTADALAGFARVQNTYLATFHTLGGLGLLLGTFGVVTVLLRNVWERRSELALMTAVGFRRSSLVAFVLVQNGLWLALGVAIGTAAALLAAAPQLASAQADVPWLGIAGTLGLVLGVGLGACALAAVTSLRGQLLAALRSE